MSTENERALEVEAVIVDVRIESHGTIYTFMPLTQTGIDWVSEKVAAGRSMIGGALVVEHRYARDLADAAISDGLEVR